MDSPHDSMAKVLVCGLEVSEFEPQLRYFVFFRTRTQGKGMCCILYEYMNTYANVGEKNTQATPLFRYEPFINF